MMIKRKGESVRSPAAKVDDRAGVEQEDGLGGPPRPTPRRRAQGELGWQRAAAAISNHYSSTRYARRQDQIALLGAYCRYASNGSPKTASTAPMNSRVAATTSSSSLSINSAM